jgi:hypothetical protein
VALVVVSGEGLMSDQRSARNMCVRAMYRSMSNTCVNNLLRVYRINLLENISSIFLQ